MTYDNQPFGDPTGIYCEGSREKKKDGAAVYPATYLRAYYEAHRAGDAGDAQEIQYEGKDVKGKLRVDLIPPEVIRALAEVFTYGMRKYKVENNWKPVPIKEWEAALKRHLLAYDEGEKADVESGLSHTKHILCNAAIMVALEAQNADMRSLR